MARDRSWKDELLRSSLPLEHDVLRYLERKGCIGSFEFSYLRPDEQQLPRQFSYDIDAAYPKPHVFVDLMVECKYRHPGVRWIFLPESYDGPDEFGPNDFCHAVDGWADARFPFDGPFPRQLAPACSKGVELLPDEKQEQTIPHAVSQLAYGFPLKVADAIEHQVRRWLGGRAPIFFVIPVIVTTAQLLRIREEVTLGDIREAKEPSDVADAHDLLVLKHKAGADLQEHNRSVFGRLAGRVGGDELSGAYRVEHPEMGIYFSLAIEMPNAIVVASVADGWSSLDRLFAYVDELMTPSDALVAEVKAQHARVEELVRALNELSRFPRRRPPDGDGA